MKVSIRYVKYLKNEPNTPQVVNLIHTQDPHPNSLAGLFLLNLFYQEQENSPKFRWFREPGYRESLTLQVAERVRSEHEGRLVCEYCGKEIQMEIPNQHPRVPKPVRFTVDHFIPLSARGPIAKLSNLIAACDPCNNKKGAQIGIRRPDGSLTWEGRN
jgi:hypothetical protein